MEEFKYTPLNLKKPAIRLLCLYPGNRNTMISGKLFHAELQEWTKTGSYEALSYTWGSPYEPATIHINGCSLKITRNLFSTLLDLRYQDRQRILWIDAVCIDQKNDKERGHQVGQMGNIYKEADSVIFRLGLGSDTRDPFMESLQRLQNEGIQHMHGCGAWSRHDSRWEDLWAHPANDGSLRQALREILERPWFRRVWILQEVAFAKAAIISCGTKSVLACFFVLAPLLLGITPDAHCQSVLDIMPSPWRESTWWSESRSLYKLLLNFGRSEATDPRDLVYALRGMSSDLADKREGDPLFPDYKKSEEKLVHDVIRYIYDFDVKHLAGTPFLSSMRELAGNLPRVEAHICRYLAEKSQPDHMEKILRTPEILVSQDMIKAAAQYDKDGMVVNVLLRCRGGEFNIDETILLCAAANLNAAKEVFEAFLSHQDQLIITEQILIATAENPTSGPSAMRFLLSLKTQLYRIAPILKAIARKASEDSRREIVRMLLQKSYGNDTIPEVLTAAAEIQDSDLQREIIKSLLQQKNCRNDTTCIPEVLTAAAAEIQDSDLQREIMKSLLQQKRFRNDTIQELLIAADKLQYYDLQKEIIKLLLQQKNFTGDTIPKIPIAAAENQYYDLQAEIIQTLLQKRGNSDIIFSEVITIAAYIQDPDLQIEIIRMLVEQKASSDTIISEVITAAAKVRDSNLQTKIVTILAQKFSNDNIISEVIPAAAGILDLDLQITIIRILIEQKVSSNIIVSKVITSATNFQDPNLRIKIIRILLERKSNSHNTISKILDFAAKSRDPDLQIQIIKILSEQEYNSDDTISKILNIAAESQDPDLQIQIIKILSEQEYNSNITIPRILTIVADSRDPDLRVQIIRILLDQKGNNNDTVSTILTVAAGIPNRGSSMLRDFYRRNPGFEISEDAVIVAIENWPRSTGKIQLLRGYFPSSRSSL